MPTFTVTVSGPDATRVEAATFETDPDWVIFLKTARGPRIAAFPREKVVKITSSAE